VKQASLKMKITFPADCGNSPRKLFLKDFNVAFAKGDVSFLMTHVSDDIQWNIIGDRAIQGKENFRSVLKEMSTQKAKALEIRKIITHGADASVSGVVTLGQGKRVSFCDVYTFQGAKGVTIKSIESYMMLV
jgi:hypothetical protein